VRRLVADGSALRWLPLLAATALAVAIGGLASWSAAPPPLATATAGGAAALVLALAAGVLVDEPDPDVLDATPTGRALRRADQAALATAGVGAAALVVSLTATPGPALRLASMVAVALAAAAIGGATLAAPTVLVVAGVWLVVLDRLWPPSAPTLGVALIALALASRDPARR
jgi:hypothetical protein